MKRRKFLAALSAIAAVTVIPCSVFAKGAAEVYISDEIKSGIVSNLYDDTPIYESMFGTENVTFDFDKAVPVYSFDSAGNPSLLSEAMLFTGLYKVPVYDENKEFIGMADFGQVATVDKLPEILKNDPKYVEDSSKHAGEWQLQCFSEGQFEKVLFDQLEIAAASEKVNNFSYDKVYCVENLSAGDGLVFSSATNPNNEIFMDIKEIPVTNNGIYQISSEEVRAKVYLSGNNIMQQELELAKTAEKDYALKYEDMESILGELTVNYSEESIDKWHMIEETNNETSDLPFGETDDDFFDETFEIDGEVKDAVLINTWSVGANSGMASASYSFEKRDDIYVKIGIVPTVSSGYVEVGIQDLSTMEFIPIANLTTDIVNKYYPITKAGSYRLYVKNHSNQTVNMRGYFIPINYTSSVLIKPDGQDKSLWCWAACIKMAAWTLNKNNYSNYSQEEIVRYAKNEVINDTGSDEDVAKGMFFATHKRYTTYARESVFTMQQMKNELDNGKPIIICWGKYDSNGWRYWSHANVVFAVDMDKKYNVDVVKMIWPISEGLYSIRRFRYAQFTASPITRCYKTISIVPAS